MCEYRRSVSRYVPIQLFWELFECCRGMFVEIPLNVTYYVFRFICDSGSGLWVLLLTAWVAKCALCFPWEV